MVVNHEVDTDEGAPPNEIKLYKKRWILLAWFALIQTLSSYLFSSVGQVSNVYVAYFKVNHWQVDWASLTYALGMCAAAPIMACLSYMKIMPLKKLSMFSAITTVVSHTCFILGSTTRSTFSLIVVGQLINGFGAGALYTIRPSFAVHWFPDSEVGTAIGVSIAGIAIGGIMGFILSTAAFGAMSPQNHLLSKGSNFSMPNITRKFSEIAVVHRSTESTGEAFTASTRFVVMNEEVWQNNVKRCFLMLYLPALSLSVIVLILMAMLMQDKPPSPPSRALVAHQRIETLETKPSMPEFFKSTLKLFTNVTYMLAALIYGFVLRTVLVEYTMMSQIVAQMRSDLPASQADTIGGYVMVTLMAGYFVGSVVGGKVVDMWKRYRRVASISIAFTLISTAGLLASYRLSSLVGLYVSNGLYGAFIFITVITLHEITTQSTFPLDATFVSAWLTGIQTSLGCILAEIGRGLFKLYAGTGVLSLQCSAMLVSLAISFAMKPQNRRLEMSEAEETQPFLNNDNFIRSNKP